MCIYMVPFNMADNWSLESLIMAWDTKYNQDTWALMFYGLESPLKKADPSFHSLHSFKHSHFLILHLQDIYCAPEY